MFDVTKLGDQPLRPILPEPNNVLPPPLQVLSDTEMRRAEQALAAGIPTTVRRTFLQTPFPNAGALDAQLPQLMREGRSKCEVLTTLIRLYALDSTALTNTEISVFVLHVQKWFYHMMLEYVIPMFDVYSTSHLESHRDKLKAVVGELNAMIIGIERAPDLLSVSHLRHDLGNIIMALQMSINLVHHPYGATKRVDISTYEGMGRFVRMIGTLVGRRAPIELVPTDEYIKIAAIPRELQMPLFRLLFEAVYNGQKYGEGSIIISVDPENIRHVRVSNETTLHPEQADAVRRGERQEISRAHGFGLGLSGMVEHVRQYGIKVAISIEKGDVGNQFVVDITWPDIVNDGVVYSPDAQRLLRTKKYLDSQGRKDFLIDQGLPNHKPLTTPMPDEPFSTRTETPDLSEMIAKLRILPGFTILSDETIEWVLKNPPTKVRGAGGSVKRKEVHSFFPETHPIVPIAGFLISAAMLVITKNPQMAMQYNSLSLTPAPMPMSEQLKRQRDALMRID